MCIPTDAAVAVNLVNTSFGSCRVNDFTPHRSAKSTIAPSSFRFDVNTKTSSHIDALHVSMIRCKIVFPSTYCNTLNGNLAEPLRAWMKAMFFMFFVPNAQ